MTTSGTARARYYRNVPPLLAAKGSGGVAKVHVNASIYFIVKYFYRFSKKFKLRCFEE